MSLHALRLQSGCVGLVEMDCSVVPWHSCSDSIRLAGLGGLGGRGLQILSRLQNFTDLSLCWAEAMQ